LHECLLDFYPFFIGLAFSFPHLESTYAVYLPKGPGFSEAKVFPGAKVMKERIRNLLASGIKPAEISSIVGCSPSYISQLLKDEDFKKEVEALIIQNAQEKTEEEHLDTRYQNLEHKILTNIENSLPEAELPHLTRALEVIAKRQIERTKIKNPIPTAPLVNITVAQIALPQHVLEAPKPAIAVNEKNEIIAIDAKSLAPMSSEGVRNIFKQLQEKKNEVKQVLEEI